MFKILRFDHMHVVPDNFARFNEKFREFLGYPVLMNMPMEQYGTNVAYEPAPIGLEALFDTKDDFGFYIELTEWVESGIFLEEISKVSNCVGNAFSSLSAGCALILQTGNPELIQKVAIPVMMGQMTVASVQSEPPGSRTTPAPPLSRGTRRGAG